MEEIRGLTATCVDTIPYTSGIITDATKRHVRLACLETRSIYDRGSNEYHTIKQYYTAWYSWKDVKINFPTIEAYRIVLTKANNTDIVEFAEGEVYSFKYHDTTIKLGINKSPGGIEFNVTDISTGLCLKTDKDVLKLRCLLPNIAKARVEVMENNINECRLEMDKLKTLPTKYTTLKYIDNDSPYAIDSFLF